MKKKLIALLTATVMTLSFTGCDDSDKKTTETPTTEAPATENIDGSIDVEIPELNEFTPERGAVEDGVFTNNAFKISFPVSDDMKVYSDEEIANLMSLSQDLMTENGIISAETYENATNGTIYDIMISFADGQSNASVAYTNLKKSGAENVTAEMYAEVTISQLKQMTSPKYTINETTTESYGGQDWTCINVNTDQGFSQKMLIREESGYMIAITLTILDDTPEIGTDFLNSFITVE